MKFRKFIAILYLIYETFFYLVTGQTNNEEINDCTKFYNFLSNNSTYYDSDVCCSNKLRGVTCDYEGNFISFERYRTHIEISDVTNFPYFSKLEFLVLDTVGFKEIPDSILKLTSLKEIHLQFNNIEIIPSAIQNLSQLEILGLDNNNIKELPNEMFKLPILRTLQLHKNNIEVIPPVIQNLSLLENINLNDNIIKELSNKIFKLPNLKALDIKNNPNLKTKMINFGNSIIKNCYFYNITISCYELHTCETIYLEDRGVLSEKINDFDAENKYGKCTKEEIDEIKNPNENKKYSSFIIISGIILGCIIVICNIILAFILIKGRKSKQSNKPNISNNDITQTGSMDNLLKLIETNNKTDVKFNNKDIYNSIDTKLSLNQELFN